MKKIQKIIDTGLCLGCGLCETIVTSKKCQMTLNQKIGFYRPTFKEKLSKFEINSILNCCPGIKVTGNKETKIWGEITQIEEAWSADPFIRKKASSGGVISSLAIHLLETKKTDAILHVGVNNDSYLYNSLRISKNKTEILRNIGSRYAPALIFDQLKRILDKSNDNYAFIGKPCDIAGLKNFIKEYPKYQNRITYFLALFCAGIPSYKGTSKVLEFAGYNEEPCFLKYRGDGWPGFFEAKYKSHPPFKISYNDSWGKVLGNHLAFRCKICPDGIGSLADIAVGDSWKTTNGYPNFEETNGRSFIMIRTKNGANLYNDAVSKNKIKNQPFQIDLLNKIQKYQFERRIYVGYRMFSIQLLNRFILKFDNIGIIKLMLKGNLYKGVKNAYGTLSRHKKNKLNEVKE